MTILEQIFTVGPTRTPLARVALGPAGFDIQPFECVASNRIDRIAVNLPIDPMKSLRANAWLRGQLRAPT
jgi:hypothetical protein